MKSKIIYASEFEELEKLINNFLKRKNLKVFSCDTFVKSNLICASIIYYIEKDTNNE